MRLPLVIPLDARENDTEQDGRMTNMVAEQYDEVVIVSARPGLSLTDQVDGAANGIVCYNGSLIAAFGDVIEYVETSAGPFNAGTDYNFSDVVFYDGFWWISTQDGNQGNGPSQGSSYWMTGPGETSWDEVPEYDIGDPVLVLGTPYYAMSPNINKPPYSPQNSPYWSLTPPGSTRWTNGSTGVVSASLSAAAKNAFDNYTTNTFCTQTPGSWQVYDAPAFLAGNWYAGTVNWTGTCDAPVNAGAGFIPQVLVQTA